MFRDHIDSDAFQIQGANDSDDIYELSPNLAEKVASSRSIRKFKVIRIDFVNTQGLKSNNLNGELHQMAQLNLMEEGYNKP